MLLLIGAAIVGLLLIIIGNSTGSASEKTNSENFYDNDEYDIINYSNLLENKIKNLCEKVKGVDNASVIVTLESGFEYVYAVNRKTDSNDNNSGSDITEYLVIKDGNKENTVFITGIAPKVCGIGIVCTGGADPNIQHEIINLISAAFDVKRNKIYISEGKK